MCVFYYILCFFFYGTMCLSGFILYDFSFMSPQISEERLSRVLKETQQQHEREMDRMQSM